MVILRCNQDWCCPARRTVRSRRLAYDQPARYLEAAAGAGVFSQDALKEGGRQPLAHLTWVLRHRCQSRPHPGGGRNIVKAHYGNVLGHAQPSLLRRVQRADRHQVVTDKYGGGGHRQIQQPLHGLKAALQRPVAELLVTGRNGELSTLDGLVVGRLASNGRREGLGDADKADACVALIRV